MSWSNSWVGDPKEISKAMDRFSGKLSGDSKTEYDRVLPHMKALVAENIPVSYQQSLKVSANGHSNNHFEIKIEHDYAELCPKTEESETVG